MMLITKTVFYEKYVLPTNLLLPYYKKIVLIKFVLWELDYRPKAYYNDYEKYYY